MRIAEGALPGRSRSEAGMTRYKEKEPRQNLLKGKM